MESRTRKNCLHKKYDLSQARTRSVLEYSFSLKELDGFDVWMRKTMSANGLSSAKLIMKENLEDKSGQGELNSQSEQKQESD